LVNRVTPEFDHPFLKTRREGELERIEELKESLGVDISSMELFDTEVVGLKRLREVGLFLYGPVIEIDKGLGPHSIGSVLHHEVHRGMVTELEGDTEIIYLHYPGIKREELSLRSEEGVLFVGLNGREKPVKTSVPVKASQVNAKLDGDVLRLDIPLNEQ
jgi:hypothetical protein